MEEAATCAHQRAFALGRRAEEESVLEGTRCLHLSVLLPSLLLTMVLFMRSWTRSKTTKGEECGLSPMKREALTRRPPGKSESNGERSKVRLVVLPMAMAPPDTSVLSLSPQRHRQRRGRAPTTSKARAKTSCSKTCFLSSRSMPASPSRMPGRCSRKKRR